MRSCAFESSDEMEGDDEDVAKVDMVRADFFCFVRARPMATSLDQIRRLFVSKGIGKQPYCCFWMSPIVHPYSTLIRYVFSSV